MRKSFRFVALLMVSATWLVFGQTGLGAKEWYSRGGVNYKRRLKVTLRNPLPAELIEEPVVLAAAPAERFAGHHLPAMLRIASQAGVSDVQICSAWSPAFFEVQPCLSLVACGGSFVCAFIDFGGLSVVKMTGGVCQKKVRNGIDTPEGGGRV